MEHPEIMLPVVITEEISPQEPIRLPGRHNSFIEANTIPGSLEEIKHQHIIPVFSNNEPLISHVDFIETASQLTADIFNGEHILKPDIRVSHPVMGRIPDAKDKPVHLLMEWEKTLYYHCLLYTSDAADDLLCVDLGGRR